MNKLGFLKALILPLNIGILAVPVWAIEDKPATTQDDLAAQEAALLSEIKEIHQKTEIQNLQNEIRRLQA